jgi:hypothetical protein
MENDQALYLRLSDDFGGTRFGPFEGVEVTLGSNEANDITIPETFGVIPDHAKVILQEGRGILITPVSQTAGVYVWKGRASKPSQISTPTAVRHGDSFAMVSPQGPRFFIEIDLLPEEMLSKRRGLKGQDRVSKAALKKEGLRQMLLRVMTTGWGQRISKAWWFVRSGEIFLPRNIFMITAIGGGWVMGTLAMCNKADAEQELAAVEAKLDIVESRKGSAEIISLENQLARVTGIPSFIDLPNEEALLLEIKAQAARIYKKSHKYKWLTDGKESNRQFKLFLDTYKAIQDWSKISEDTRRILPWIGSTHRLFQAGEDLSWWAVSEDSRGKKVCNRGPLSMTWTQAYHLGMDTKLDFFTDEELPGEGEDTLKALRRSANRSPNFDKSTITEDLMLVTRRPKNDDYNFCRVEEGAEGRDALSKLQRALAPGRKGLPDSDSDSYRITVATLMKFYAVDFSPEVDLSSSLRVDFDDEAAEKWVTERTAKTLAAAAVLPCLLVTESKKTELVKEFAEDGYQPIDCILLKYVVENEDISLK